MPLVPSVPETGSQLRLWRRHHGLTQQELSASLGVSAGTIGRWERGDSPLHADIRALFPKPPLLPLKTGRSHREPTKAELAMAKKASKAFAQMLRAVNENYAKSAGDLLLQFQRAHAAQNAVMQNVRAAAADMTHMTSLQRGIREIAAIYQKSLGPLLDQLVSFGQLIASAFPTDEEFKQLDFGGSRLVPGPRVPDRGGPAGRQFSR